MTTLTRKGFETFLNKIRAADERQVKAQLDIASLLAAIKEHKLYDTGDYGSFTEMVKKELPFSIYTANSYVKLYQSYERLGYTKPEFLKILQAHDWRIVWEALENSKSKLGIRAIQNYLDKKNQKPKQQFNFHLPDEQQCLRLETLLSRFGLEVTEGGSRSHMTDALIALLDDYERLDQKGSQMTLLDSADTPETDKARIKREAAAHAAYVRKSNATKEERKKRVKQAA